VPACFVVPSFIHVDWLPERCTYTFAFFKTNFLPLFSIVSLPSAHLLSDGERAMNKRQ
jgi:hypothetical protein